MSEDCRDVATDKCDSIPPIAATRKRLEQLKKLDDHEFDRIWSILLECGEQERHFNTVQSAYRRLASTWLLAMFGGLGFIFKETVTYSQRWVAVCAIGIAAAIGIILLCVLDVLVYHRLMLAYFETGKDIEEACDDWLPPFRRRMRSSKNPKAVRKNIAAFYFGLGSAAVFVSGLGAYQAFGPVGLFIPILIVTLGIVLFRKTLGM